MRLLVFLILFKLVSELEEKMNHIYIVERIVKMGMNDMNNGYPKLHCHTRLPRVITCIFISVDFDITFNSILQTC